ncbi:unnamed protein product [Hydatigera taeniaeformis]|uniref:Myotubularin phosphatase domain-containing protein n=1 Tax=Hydatigena taeniaeformis TaxID=6205 RepID=A0A0R3WYB2_HYDTA|nr:unnamed protein product [Hydatigera taeniaeformis]
MDMNLVSGTIPLPISQDLPKGYLDATTKSARRAVFTHQPFSSSVSNGVYPINGIEPAWLDNKRSLFTLTLEPVSTMYSLDAKLVSFFDTCAVKLAIYTVPIAADAIVPSVARVGGVFDCFFFTNSSTDKGLFTILRGIFKSSTFKAIKVIVKFWGGFVAC